MSGVCVTFDNTALRWDTSALGAAFDPAGKPHPELTDRIGAWLDDCQPALRGGNCWIGGWYNPANGKMELNLTAVFRSEHREAAEQFGRFQGQVAVYDLDIAAAGAGNPVAPVGSGGETDWTPPPPPRRRRLLRTR